MYYLLVPYWFFVCVKCAYFSYTYELGSNMALESNRIRYKKKTKTFSICSLSYDE